MDLDKIKDKWQSAEVKASIDESKIQQMLDNKGKGAYNYLVNYEQIALIVSICALVATIIVTIFKFEFVPIFLCSSIAVITVWQLYKLYFLKQISVSEMNLLQISNKINTYKLYMFIEWVFAIMWALLACILLVYNDINFLYRIDYADNSTFYIHFIIKCILLLLIIIGLTYLIYRLTIAKNIKKLEKSIREVKEIENDNI